MYSYKNYATNSYNIYATLRLRDDLWYRGDGTSSWYPAWIPLALAKTTEDSLFKNILEIEGPQYHAGPKAGQRQTLRSCLKTLNVVAI